MNKCRICGTDKCVEEAGICVDCIQGEYDSLTPEAQNWYNWFVKVLAKTSPNECNHTDIMDNLIGLSQMKVFVNNGED